MATSRSKLKNITPPPALTVKGKKWFIEINHPWIAALAVLALAVVLSLQR